MRHEQHDFGESVGVDEVERLLMDIPLQSDTEVTWDLNLSVCSHVEPGAGFRFGNALRRWGLRELTVQVPDPGDFGNRWFLTFTRSGIGLALSASAGKIFAANRDVTHELRDYYAAKGNVPGTNYGIRTELSTGALTPDEERFGCVFRDLAVNVQLSATELSHTAWCALTNLLYEAVLNVVDHAFKDPWPRPPAETSQPLSYLSLRRYKDVSAEGSSHGGLREYLRRAKVSAKEDRQDILKWIELVACDNGIGIAARQSQNACIYREPIDVEDDVLREALAVGGSIKLKSGDAAVHGDPGYGLSIIAGGLKKVGAYAALRTGRRLVELDSTLDSPHFIVREEVLGWMPGTALHVFFPVRNPQLHL